VEFIFHVLGTVAACCLLSGVALFFIERRVSAPRLRVALQSCVGALLFPVVLAILDEPLVRFRLSKSPAWQQRVFARVSGASAGALPPETALNFMPHPVLGFSLNPDADPPGRHETNREFLIRREEPLDADAKVAWRALVLGGSTTFGWRIRNEGDTWVKQAEAAFRAAVPGRRIELINAGVPNYTVMENALHFEHLLAALKPDVVFMLVGLNDTTARLAGTLTADYSNYRKRWSAEVNLSTGFHIGLLPWFMGNNRLLSRVQRMQAGLINTYVEHELAPLEEYAAQFSRNGAQVYRQKLQALVRSVQARRSQVVLLPQLMLNIERGDDVVAGAVAEHNQVNREVAAETGAGFIEYLDGVPPPFAAEDMLDGCHFNAAGHKKMAQLFSSWVLTSHQTWLERMSQTPIE
jgi:lysophospholipase L1-like esterase